MFFPCPSNLDLTFKHDLPSVDLQRSLGILTHVGLFLLLMAMPSVQSLSRVGLFVTP